MVLVRKTTLAEWKVLRDIRLEALRDSPDFFGSTYQDQQAITPMAWRASIARGVTFFAYLSWSTGASPSGLVGGLHEVPDTVELVSLWVRPEARGQGVAKGLVRAVVDWAREHRAGRVHLWLTKTNDQASRPRTMGLHADRREPAAAVESEADRDRHGPAAEPRSTLAAELDPGQPHRSPSGGLAARSRGIDRPGLSVLAL